MIRWGRITGLCVAVFCLLHTGRRTPRRWARRCSRSATGERVRPSSRAGQTARRQDADEVHAAGRAGQGEVAQGRRRRLRRVDHGAERLRQVHVREDGAGAAAGLGLPDGRDLPLARREGPHAADRARDVAGVRCPRRARTSSCATSPTIGGLRREGLQPRPHRRPGRSTSPSSSTASRWAPRVVGLAPGQSIDVFMPGAACADGEPSKRSSTRARRWTSPTRRTTRSRLLLSLYARLHW